jgi:hypothetical protein
MGIFGRLWDKIRGRAPQPEVPPPPPAPVDSMAGAVPPPPPPIPMADVDVEAILTAMAKEYPHKLNWRTSIVDLMKLLDMESSLAERRELADELGFTGDKSDTATMNIWLHKQVLRKFAENGGRVPADLLD